MTRHGLRGLTTLTLVLTAGSTLALGQSDRPRNPDLSVLVMTEESCAQWGRARDSFQLDDDRVLILRSKTHARPSLTEWETGWVQQIFELVKRTRIGLVVIDTISAFWPVKEENSAGEVTDALRPLRVFTDAGVAVLLLHHPKKGESSFEDAHRGSGALAGFADIIMTMSRIAGASDDDRQRLLKVTGRMDDLPHETVIELTDDGYVVRGTRADATTINHAETIVQILTRSCGEWMTIEEIRHAWPVDDPRPSEKAVRSLLKSRPDDRWLQDGRGTKKSPFRYRLPPQNSFLGTSNPHVGQGIESRQAISDILTAEARP